VERHLAEYVSPATDTRAIAEMVQLIRQGMTSPDSLPEVLPAVESHAQSAPREHPGRRSRRPRTA